MSLVMACKSLIFMVFLFVILAYVSLVNLREYPNFFKKLYNLLDEEALHVRYRPRFMRMLDTFLSSP